MKQTPCVTVVGSINMDLAVTTERMPNQGETILGNDFTTYSGGKGANQAVAAARFGANVQMIGAVGNDSFGTILLENLAAENVDLTGVQRVKDKSTGIANIIVSQGDNRIIVAPGANLAVTTQLVDLHRSLIKQSDVVLLQLEIPIETVIHTIHLANLFNVPVIVNPAPYQDLPDSVVKGATYLTPNKLEAAEMTMVSQKKMIITKGEEGVTFYENGNEVSVPGYSVNTIDTTGAGDTFNGVLACEIGSGTKLATAIRQANAAAALSVTKRGAQGGMPKREEVEKFLYLR